MLYRLVFTTLMSLVLASFMTMWVTWINLGLTPDFIFRWLTAFMFAWPMAWLIAFMTSPTVMKVSRQITDKLSNKAE